MSGRAHAAYEIKAPDVQEPLGAEVMQHDLQHLQQHQ